MLNGAFVLGCSEEVFNQKGRADTRTLRVYFDESSEHKLYYGKNKDDIDKNNNDQKHFITYSDDYIVVVKICPDDYNYKEHGSTIIAFGNSAEGTKTAVNFFTTHTKKFYNILKKAGHMNHYFYVFHCSSKGEVDFREGHYSDLTKDMLESDSTEETSGIISKTEKQTKETSYK